MTINLRCQNSFYRRAVIGDHDIDVSLILDSWSNIDSQLGYNLDINYIFLTQRTADEISTLFRRGVTPFHPRNIISTRSHAFSTHSVLRGFCIFLDIWTVTKGWHQIWNSCKVSIQEFYLIYLQFSSFLF